MGFSNEKRIVSRESQASFLPSFSVLELIYLSGFLYRRGLIARFRLKLHNKRISVIVVIIIIILLL